MNLTLVSCENLTAAGDLHQDADYIRGLDPPQLYLAEVGRLFHVFQHQNRVKVGLQPVTQVGATGSRSMYFLSQL